MVNFPDWLAKQLQDRKLSPTEFARLAHKAPAVITRILNGERNPANATLDAIAEALDLPKDVVYRAAGVLSKNDQDPWAETMVYRLSQISPSRRKIAEGFIKTLLEDEDAERTPYKDPKTSPVK